MPWVHACAADDIENDDLIRWDHAGQSYALYRTEDDDYFATDGLCSHEQVQLCNGLLMGHLVECPKHNGRFDIRTGQAVRAPATVALRIYPVKVDGDALFVDLPGEGPE